jgi:hypothetical protein
MGASSASRVSIMRSIAGLIFSTRVMAALSSVWSALIVHHDTMNIKEAL